MNSQTNPSVRPVVLLLIVLFISHVLSSLLPTNFNTSDVCSPSEVWTSCSHQFSGDKVRDINGCTVQRVSHLKPEQQDSNGVALIALSDQSVHLQVYRHQASGLFYEASRFYKTAFNLTVTNPRLGSMNFCYADPVLPTSAVVCIDFIIKDEYLDQNFTLWYDCVFRDRGFEGAPYLLNIYLGDQKSQFYFNVPKENDLVKNPVFLYTHFATSQKLAATFQLNSLEVIEYRLRLLRWDDKTEHILEEKTVNLQNPSSFMKRWSTLVTVAFNAELPAGNYTVTASCDDSSCSGLSSSFIVMKEGSGSSAIILLAVVGAGITLFGTATYVYMNYRKDLKKQGDSANPSLVLLYDPVSRFHCDQVRAVRLFLHKYLSVNVLLDMIDVPVTDHKDPLKWYSSVIAQTGYVAIVVPPPGPVTASGSVSIYQNTFSLALQLLGRRLANSLSSVFLITLVNSSLERVPDVCHSLERFKLPREVRKLQKRLKSFSRNCQFTQSTCEVEFENLLQSLQEKVKEPAISAENLEYCKNIEDGISDTDNESDESTHSSRGLRFYRDGKESDESSSSEDEDGSISFGDVKLTFVV